MTEAANNGGMTSLYVRGIQQQQEMVALTDGKGWIEEDLGWETDYFWVMMLKTL